jgi:hemerythrin-like domain-containing protein
MHQTARLLHDEHMAASGLLKRLEGLLATHAPTDPPDAADPAVNALLGDLAAALEGEIVRHFDFEEETLFPLLAAEGDGAVGELLGEEHVVIRPLMAEVAALARGARSDGFMPESWRTLHRLGNELVDRLGDHIQKEEMGLVRIVDELLGDEQDSELALAHAAGG